MGQDDKLTRDLTSKEWAQRYMDQLGSTINYGLGLSTASIGFCATQISQPNATSLSTSYRAAVLWLGASVMCGIGCSLFRLSIFLMRRTSDPDMPNGLTDFVIIETISWMAGRGLNGLGLNFAVMRAVIAGETGSGRWQSAEKSLLHHFSDSMQIESLWNFNKKYDPQWLPRYSVADERAHLPRAGLAIARAETVSELPVVGKFMKPKTPVLDGQPDPALDSRTKELVP